MNRGIITSLSAIGIAQGLKLLTQQRKTGNWEWKALVQPGGMPSSHSAGVASLASYIAANKGTTSIDSALAVIFGGIVMYDAQGVRRHTGEIAKLVNDLDENIDLISDDFPSLKHTQHDKELKEVLGHQPLEVAGGALLGLILGLLSALIENNSR